MAKDLKLVILLDFYGGLLTEKQAAALDGYYNQDLSLAEIAEVNKTSRQAIHDLIKRCYKQLLSYESKLNLLQKSMNREKKIIDLLEFIKDKTSIKDDNLNEVKKKLEDLY